MEMDNMAVDWRTLKIFFKKSVSSRTLWISGGVTIFGVFVAISMLTGITITSNGDIYCENKCDIFVNITTTYWNICFNTTKFEPLYFDKEPLDYEVYVPAAGNNWRYLKAGDCITRGKINRFKIVVEKKKWETIKYGVKVGEENLDPYLYSANVIIKNGTTYEKLCDEVKENVCNTIPLYKNITFEVYKPFDGICKDTFVNKTETYCVTSEVRLEAYDYQKVCQIETTNCINNGAIKINGTILSIPRYFCGTELCDEYKGFSGGGADGNGDGICQKGETCIKY